ncbi:lycopene cyclase family protein [Aridibaculum aurantiacum]|uniref:lycopene cyclase family protein n=1 Tax=Aridibaculum aurantiacum TaxID=2810307 RepID=UPI001A977CDB
MKHYDYIISGAGAAGLSLLMRMMQHKYFETKNILVVDKAPKTKNDRTWCYWEKQQGLFDVVVHHRWQQVNFFSDHFSSQLDLSPYQYKMIRGIDFYNHVIADASTRANITFLYGEVEAVGNEGANGLVVVNGERYTASYVFNSILFSKPAVPADKYFLLQHFKGWMIETAAPAFNPTIATLMDFRVSQQHGTTFVYVLPVAANKALVEYTLFTKELLPPDDYNQALQHYISSRLGIEQYEVTEEEFGAIPMTNIKFVKKLGRVINVGTAGGQTKASSGYTFQFIQKQTQQLVEDLVFSGEIKQHDSFFERRFQLYDSTLLNILHNNKLGGDKIFSDLFRKNEPARVLRFLDNESDIEDEIKIMASVPPGIFMKAALQELFK